MNHANRDTWTGVASLARRRESHLARASVDSIVLAALLALPSVCHAGRYQTVVHPVVAPEAAAPPPRLVSEIVWPRTRLGYVTDSLTMQLVFHPEIGFGYAEPRGVTRIGREDPVDSLQVYIGQSGAGPRIARYEVFIDARHGDLVRPALARVRLTHGSEPPRRVLESYWYPEPHPDFGEAPGPPASMVDTTEADEDPTFRSWRPTRLNRWVTHTRDTMVVEVRIDPEAMNAPVWLPAAGRWTVDGDETARYVVTAAFY